MVEEVESRVYKYENFCNGCDEIDSWLINTGGKISIALIPIILGVITITDIFYGRIMVDLVVRAIFISIILRALLGTLDVLYKFRILKYVIMMPMILCGLLFLMSVSEYSVVKIEEIHIEPSGNAQSTQRFLCDKNIFAETDGRYTKYSGVVGSLMSTEMTFAPNNIYVVKYRVFMSYRELLGTEWIGWQTSIIHYEQIYVTEEIEDNLSESYNILDDKK